MNSLASDSDTAANLKSEKLVEDIFADLQPGDEANIECYTRHAEKYDKGFCGLQFENPKRFAFMALKHLKTASVNKLALDICAGTGLMTEELMRQGFSGYVDAVDGNDKMLGVAKKKSIFRHLHRMVITPDSRLPFPDNTYDVALCCGAFSPGHLRAECLPEFFRVLKSGGTFVFNTTNFNQHDNKALDEDMDVANAVLSRLEKHGVCKLMESMTGDCFSLLSNGFKYKNGNVDLIRCYIKL